MIEPVIKPEGISQSPRAHLREIQLFEPSPGAVYTIEATSRLVNVSRHAILVYCKHRLLSPASITTEHGYCFDGDAIRALRRIETLRSICGEDLAGIKIILELTAALERLRWDTRLLLRSKGSGAREASAISSKKRNVKSNYRRKRK
jgi:DNA-binding transcriptional MerR regulator